MKMLHTADVHLGARFAMLGQEKGRTQRLQLEQALERIGGLAADERVDAVLIAGDLFDSNSPSARSLETVRRLFDRLAEAGIRVFVIPGTHDSYDGSSVWRTLDLGSSAGMVTVFTDKTDPVVVPELDLTVYGLVFAGKTAPVGALEKLRRSTDTRFHIGLVHGSLVIPDIAERDSLSFTAEEAAQTGMDYLALGHWHSFRKEQFGQVAACYPGAPELISIDQKGAGQVAMIDIGSSGEVKVESRVVGTKRFESLELAVDVVPATGRIVEAIRAKADPDLVLEVALTGLSTFDLDIDADEIVAEAAADFFSLRIKDKSHPRLDDSALAGLVESTVTGKFARVMAERIRRVEGTGPVLDRERAVYEDALRLGVALLEGKQVLG